MEQNNQSIQLPDNIEQILLDITKKYNIEQTKDEISKKIDQNENSNTIIIALATKQYFLKNISDNELVDQLKDGLKISDEIANKISVDIKEKIIPQTKILVVGADGNLAIENIKPIIKQPTVIKNNPTPPKKIQRIKKPVPSEENNNFIQKPQQRIGPDSYREPIE